MVIGVTGKKRCGKGTVAAVLVKEYGFVEMGFADALREIPLAIDPIVLLRNWGADGGLLRYSDIVACVGYERAKEEPEVRRFLQRLGTEAGRGIFGENVWVDLLARRIDKIRKTAKCKRSCPAYSNYQPPYVDCTCENKDIVVSDVRFPNEARYIRSVGQLWRVNRPGFASDDTHASEIHIAGLRVDAEITATSLDDLRTQTVALYEGMTK